ncbi:sensor histidine kinase [Dongshaea marina]|uniref:sensor histidine kinase n=1 Tax=Dongshaea marina TaxID=2047966 RepID=UPI00131EFD7F|nr:ATP-binding protein [Dongshaea marina]
MSLDVWLAQQLEALKVLYPGLELGLNCSCEDAELDQRLMSVAIQNLLTNACKYASAKVNLEVVQQEDALLFVVDDDGPGVPEEERSKLFEPFYRLSRESDQAAKGFGLGLSIVQLIAELHGGEIEIAESPSGGARFILSIEA